MHYDAGRRAFLQTLVQLSGAPVHFEAGISDRLDPIGRALAYISGYLKLGGEAVLSRFQTAAPLLRVKSVSESWGIPSRGIRLPDRLEGLVGIFLLFTADYQDAYVLIQDGLAYKIWHAGAMTHVLSVPRAEILGEAVQFYGVLPPEPVSIKQYWMQALAGFFREKAMMVFGGIVVFGFGLIFSLSVHYLLDDLIPQGLRSSLVEMIVWLSGMVIGMGVFQWIRVLAVVRWTVVSKERLSQLLWWRLLQLPLSFFRQFSVGDMLYRLQSVGDAIRFLKTSTITLFFSGVFSLMAVLILGVVSPVLLFKLVFMLGPFLALLGWGLRRQYHEFTRLQVASGKLSGFAYQLVSGISKIRLANAHHRFFAMWGGLFYDKITILYRYKWLKELQGIFFMLLPSVTLFALLMHMDLQALSAPVSVGSFLFLVMFLTQWATALGGLYFVISEALPILALLKRLDPVLAACPEVFRGRKVLPQMSGRLEVAAVSFYYQPGRLLLNEISFQLNPGAFVAIVGPSGCGKSTLLNVVMGFDQPQTGSIFYDGVPLSELDLVQLRRSFGVVLQDGVLLPGDLLSNIIGGLPLTLDDAWEAARLAGIAADIEAMPMGMHTLLTDEGKSLSGGQRQRLMLARALVNRPKILFLDEATSALDNVTQAQITAHLSELKITRVVVAHRLSTIVHADLILVMDQGRIVERGTYDTLMAEAGGIFRQLASRQIA